MDYLRKAGNMDPTNAEIRELNLLLLRYGGGL
jgi:hypothetical protein